MDLERRASQLLTIVQSPMASHLIFASSLTNAGVHIDNFNPENLTNNCAFVTIAYLLNTDAQSLCDFIGIRPSPFDAGVDLDTIIDALKRVGATYRWRSFVETKRAIPTEGNSWQGEDRYCRYPGRGTPEGRRYGVGWPSQVGVAYRRPDGTGHVVVLKLPGTPYRYYMDYQQSRRGRDVTREVKQGTAHLMFSISLDPPPSFEFHPGAHEQTLYTQTSFNGGPQWAYCESQNGVEYMEEDWRSDLDGEGVADNEEQLIEYMEQDRQTEENGREQWVEYREQDRRSLSSVEGGVDYEYDTDDDVDDKGYEDEDVGDENDYYAEEFDGDIDDEYDEQDVYVKGNENVYYAEDLQDIYDENVEEFDGEGGQEVYEENPYSEHEIWSMSRVSEALPNMPMFHCCECQPEDCCPCVRDLPT